ncbi:MAG: ThuA domain-containing protein, partial [Planctomycetaceae bacterium]|nr:ThuA domain-containing protein [Planctomycetaceae bacterium]
MRSLLLAVLFCAACTTLPAAEPASKADEKDKEKPIRALLVTGGCCHDYDRQKLILTKGISARANVEWTIVQQGGKTTNTKIPLYEDPNWAEGFDIVIHNECFSNVPDVEWVERILKPHREGTPAILIHCAMHCYRTGTDKWFEFVGVQSPGHGPHYSYTVENLKPEHPIMEGFGKRWVAPKGELYHTIKLWDSATPLAQAKRQSDQQPQTCVWTNEYGKARVFCTTIGHYNETMADPAYLDMVTRGLLWAVKRDPKTHFRPSTHKVDEEIRALTNAPVNSQKTSQLPQKCCGDGNLVTSQPTKASSEEKNKKNFAKNAVDGDLRTRWCANGGASGQTWQVELEQPAHVRSLRIHWEKDNAAYRYKVDASPDGKTWKEVVDQSQNKKVAKITPHKVDVPSVKHLRVTFLGSSTGVWGSFWEFEAYEGDLPKLPEGLTNSSSGSPSASIADVQAPAGFDVNLFANPPEVNY